MQGFKFPKVDAPKIPDVAELAGSQIGRFLKGMGIDIAQVTGFVGEIVGELRAHNERAERMEAQATRIEEKLDAINAGLVAVEHVMVATSPEARALIGEANAFEHPETQAALREAGLLDAKLYEGGAVPVKDRPKEGDGAPAGSM